jgi:Tol biopolymer transport system component
VSHDGRRVAYLRREGTELWVGTTDGARGRRIALEQGGLLSPAWTFDDRSLVVPRYVVPDRFTLCAALYSVSGDGRRVRRVTEPARGHHHDSPSVSPDGRRIAFLDWNQCEGGTAEYALRVVDMSGRPTRDLSKLPANAVGEPAWSPDGRTIALAGNGLQLAQRDGTVVRRLTPRNLLASRPRWAPGGTWIAFTGGYDNRPFGVYAVRRDGTGFRRLVRDADPAGWLARLPSR